MFDSLFERVIFRGDTLEYIPKALYKDTDNKVKFDKKRHPAGFTIVYFATDRNYASRYAIENAASFDATPVLLEGRVRRSYPVLINREGVGILEFKPSIPNLIVGFHPTINRVWVPTQNLDWQARSDELLKDNKDTTKEIIEEFLATLKPHSPERFI